MSGGRARASLFFPRLRQLTDPAPHTTNVAHPRAPPIHNHKQIEGDGLRAVSVSVDELRARFRHATVAATIECAGNRRAEMKAIPSPGGGGHAIKGLDWDAGAIGTAVWGGVRLRDVLLAAGLDPDDPNVRHIHFVGLDKDESGTPYAASIPAHKVCGVWGCVCVSGGGCAFVCVGQGQTDAQTATSTHAHTQ